MKPKSTNSFGIMMAEMLTETIPYSDLEIASAIHIKVANNPKLRPSLPTIEDISQIYSSSDSKERTNSISSTHKPTQQEIDSKIKYIGLIQR